MSVSDQSDGGNSIHSLWFLWPCANCAADEYTDREGWKYDADGLHCIGYHDSSNNYCPGGNIVLPAAKSGVIAGIVLGIGRAIGETMAVVMVAGNQTRMPAGLFKGLRTMTANIVLEMGYAADLHREALIATGVVLFVFILIINLAVSMLNRRTFHE